MKIVDNGTDITLIGYLTDNKGDKVTNALVRVFEEHTFINSGLTDDKGYFKITIPTTGVGIRHLRIVFDGNENYNCCEVTDIDVTVREPSTVSKLKLETNKTNYQLGERVELTVTCKSQYNELLQNIPLTITANNNVLETVNTGTEGIAKTKITPNQSGNLSLKAKYNDIESNAVTINVIEGNIYEIIAGLNDKIDEKECSGSSDINLDDLEVDFDIDFGVRGVQDIMDINIFLKNVGENL